MGLESVLKVEALNLQSAAQEGVNPFKLVSGDLIVWGLGLGFGVSTDRVISA